MIYWHWKPSMPTTSGSNMKPASELDAQEAIAVKQEANGIDPRKTLPLCGEWEHTWVGFVGGSACITCGHVIAHGNESA